MNDGGGFALSSRHVQCINDQLRRHLIADLPADDATTVAALGPPNIEDDGEKDKPLPGRHVGHMARGQPLSDPKLVRCFSDKLAVYAIGCRALFLVALRGDDVTAAAAGLRGGLGPGLFTHAAPVVAPHDMRDAVLPDINSLIREFRPNLRHAVALALGQCLA